MRKDSPASALAAPPAGTAADSRRGAPQPEPRLAATKPLPLFRPPDRRPRHDDERLARMGIRRYESRRLALYTDIPAEKARLLPPLLDRAYDAWVEYFGELPADRAGGDWQITGYLIGDRELFRRSGVVPGDLPPFVNGRHRGREFWMYDQEEDYYRRHLMIHEATHCYMTTMPGVVCPLWYLEGMAELCGTHRIENDGTVRFRVMPHDKREFAGLGRITLIRQDVKARGYRRLDELEALRPDDFLKNEAYAWSWALCHFFDAHPRYSARFRDIARRLGTQPFDELFRGAFESDAADVATGWAVFASTLDDGYDLERAAIEFRPGEPLRPESAEARCDVQAGRGWQSSGVLVEQGQEYEIAATGRFTLATEPRPWLAEPRGISFRYFDGRPLGQLLATVRGEATGDGRGPESMLETFAVGAGPRITAPRTGTLYLRLNDSWSELADNSGEARVTIRAVAERGR
ncbi:MAG: hypothetical protein WED34_18490 [Planctomycetales bacterium]